VILHYINTACYIVIHPGVIIITKKLSYSQTGKLVSRDFKVGYLLHPNYYEIYSTSWWFAATLCVQIQLLTSWFTLVWCERRRSCHFPEQENWDHLIWKGDNSFILTPMRFIQLLCVSPLHYVSKYSFLHRNSSSFDSNDKEVVIFPNRKTRITWFKSGITSSS